ncbi:MAG TPA: Asp-tRNA(Asn)/Glu-tRNA(Gln) amidotransferase subunit GatA, partial [Anaerolineaceae bacterium]|nr:Asp-tRNA(Asn)/Glu-tRNA(Gln) amidotransferase subunit GatA [Anaerolineaceae bacterium]
MQLCDHSAHQLLDLLHSKQISAQEIVESSLERINMVDGRPGSLDASTETDQDHESVHAFISVTAEQALQQANMVDQQR